MSQKVASEKYQRQIKLSLQSRQGPKILNDSLKKPLTRKQEPSGFRHLLGKLNDRVHKSDGRAEITAGDAAQSRPSKRPQLRILNSRLA